MKIAILNDTHAGVRGDMVQMAKYQGRFYTEVFFPYLIEHDIKHILHLGDYFDRRKYINFSSLKANREHFIQPMLDNDIKMDLIIGNHDTYYKNTNEVNSPDLLLFEHDNINVITEPIVKDYDGLDIALVPWINNENYADNIEFFQSAPAPICMGHFEIEGAMMNPAMVCSHGLNPSYLKRFENWITEVIQKANAKAATQEAAAERLRKRLEARQCNPVAKTRQFDEVSSRYFLHNKDTGESKWENEGGRYSQYETDEGVTYYVPEGGGESVWYLPENAEIVQ